MFFVASYTFSNVAYEFILGHVVIDRRKLCFLSGFRKELMIEEH